MKEKTIYSDFKAVLKENGFFFLMVFSLYVGQGISYGPLCLFHFTIPLYVFNELRNGLNWNGLLTKDVFPIHLFYLLIFGISLLHPLNYSYLYFYGLSYLIFCLLWLKRDFIILNYRSLALFLFCLFSLDIIIASLEFLTPFRYPISRISSINHLFGREYNMFLGGNECFDLNYVLSSPTGFHWNQNNLAFILLILFPFTFLFKNVWLKNCLRMVLLILVVSIGSRLGFYTLVILYSFLWIAEFRKMEWQQLIPILTIAFILSDGFYVFPTGMKKIKEVAIISQSEFTDRFPEHCYEKKDSQASRKELLLMGKDYFSQNPFTGSGAGGFTQKMQEFNRNSEGSNLRIVANAHNFMVELMVDFGIFILVPIGLIFLNLFKFLKSKNSRNRLLSFLMGLSFIAGSIMLSSLVYFLPFYLFFFLLYTVLSSKKGNLLLD
jgi:hypothetical protein